jgi:hypothetical protein
MISFRYLRHGRKTWKPHSHFNSTVRRTLLAKCALRNLKIKSWRNSFHQRKFWTWTRNKKSKIIDSNDLYVHKQNTTKYLVIQYHTQRNEASKYSPKTRIALQQCRNQLDCYHPLIKKVMDKMTLLAPNKISGRSLHWIGKWQNQEILGKLEKENWSLAWFYAVI